MDGTTLYAPQIVVRQLSECEWRISDGNINDTDALSLLGFIMKTGEYFEVTRLGAPLDHDYFHTLDDAVNSFRG